MQKKINIFLDVLMRVGAWILYFIFHHEFLSSGIYKGGGARIALPLGLIYFTPQHPNF